MIDREIAFKMGPFEDGGLQIWSDDLPGVVLSFRDERAVLLYLGAAIVALLERRGTRRQSVG